MTLRQELQTEYVQLNKKVVSHLNLGVLHEQQVVATVYEIQKKLELSQSLLIEVGQTGLNGLQLVH